MFKSDWLVFALGNDPQAAALLSSEMDADADGVSRTRDFGLWAAGARLPMCAVQSTDRNELPRFLPLSGVTPTLISI
jgi:hypothetical protein